MKSNDMLSIKKLSGISAFSNISNTKFFKLLLNIILRVSFNCIFLSVMLVLTEILSLYEFSSQDSNCNNVGQCTCNDGYVGLKCDYPIVECFQMLLHIDHNQKLYQ